MRRLTQPHQPGGRQLRLRTQKSPPHYPGTGDRQTYAVKASFYL